MLHTERRRSCHFCRQPYVCVFSVGRQQRRQRLQGNVSHLAFEYVTSQSASVTAVEFKINQFVSIGCGGLFTAPTGSIHSRNYPKNYQMDNCEWHINVEQNHRVSLKFTSFDVTDSENCSGAYVEVCIFDTLHRNRSSFGFYIMGMTS